MGTTIEEVAKQAGVSSSTVSRVLNGSKYVRPELTERVRRAIDLLNYRPNKNARHLALKTSDSVGLVVPTLRDGEVSRFLASSVNAFNEHGFELMIGKTGRRSATELELVEAQLRSRVQGIVLAVASVSDELRRALRRSGIPCLFVYSEDPGGFFPSIVFDNEEAAVALIGTIDEAAEKRFTVISGPSNDLPMMHRLRGCRREFERLDVGRVPVSECDVTVDSGYSLALDAVVNENPDVIVCLDDMIAIGAIRACYDHGVRVPDDVEVTGFSAGYYSTFCSPPLRTVRFDSETLGVKTAEALTELIAQRPVPTLQVLGYEIELGGSCR